jgi:predicted acetyltransferase
MSVTTDFDIRLVGPEDPAYITMALYAFSESPSTLDDDDKDYHKYLSRARIFMSYDGAAAVAKVGTHPMTINVRGSVLPMGGVGGVASMPAGRRGGHVRALMTRAFEQMREDGLPVSTLYPFRESFYERLGYASFPAPKFVTLNPTDLVPLLRTARTASAEHMMIADGFDRWVEFLQTYQEEHHGFALQNATRMASIRDENKRWLTLVREGSEITGAMTYNITGHGHGHTMKVRTFLARTVAARYQLLEWIGRHADQVEKARIRVSPEEAPELWYRDLNDAIQTDGEDSWGPPMGRIVSLGRIAGIGAGDGEVTVEIADEQCPWNTGVWTLRGSGGTLQVEQGDVPLATLTIQSLSALIFNGIDPDILPFRGWGNLDAEASAQLRSLFPPAAPFLYEEF